MPGHRPSPSLTWRPSVVHGSNHRDSIDSFISSISSSSTSTLQGPLLPATSDSQAARKPSELDEDEERANDASSKSKDESVTWMSLPKKGQLAVLTIARLSEPLSERSLAAYMFFQLKWFDQSLPDSTITSQGGLLTAAFAAAQFFTAVWWGRAADTPWIGRKKVLLVGLTGTAIASIGVGFSKSFYEAFFFRALAGALNGNIGVMRTMLSEIIKEKKYQSRAFLLLPMCFNIGVVIGPILGGFLADPVTSFPNVFGPGSRIGGKDGVGWMNAFPYALPNLFSGVFILISAVSVVFGLDETHEALRHKPDYGRVIGRKITDIIYRRRRRRHHQYQQLPTDETELQLTPAAPPAAPTNTPASGSTVFPRSVPDAQQQSSHSTTTTTTDTTTTTKPTPCPSPSNSPPPFRQILTKNIVLTLTTHHLLALHVSAFNALIILLLPAPHNANTHHTFPTLRFTGGLGLPQSHVGLAMAILGTVGLPLQILLYPRLAHRLGTLRSYRLFLPCSALAYTALPFLALLPQTQTHTATLLTWALLALVLAAQVLARTFALTATVILVNNAAPPHARASVHGLAQAVSSAARMLGPTLGGWLLGRGLRGGCVGGVWWGMAAVVLLNWTLLWFVFEGDGEGGRG